MTQLYDDLCKLDELFSSSEKWTKGAMARVAKGKKSTTPTSINATCWCLTGGVTKVASGKNSERYDDLLCALINSMGVFFIEYEYLTSFNDARNRTFNQIKKVIAHAKEAAKQGDCFKMS